MRVNSGATTTSWLTLFASMGTLICCALPLLLVTLGFGASVAALTNSAPFLISLSEHKEWIFAGSGALLLVSAWLLYRPGQTCPVDPEKKARIVLAPGEKPDVDKIKKTITDAGFTPGKATVRTEEIQ